MQIFPVLGDLFRWWSQSNYKNQRDWCRDDVSGKNLLEYVEKKHKEIIEHLNVMTIQSIIRKWLDGATIIF